MITAIKRQATHTHTHTHTIRVISDLTHVYFLTFARLCYRFASCGSLGSVTAHVYRGTVHRQTFRLYGMNPLQDAEGP